MECAGRAKRRRRFGWFNPAAASERRRAPLAHHSIFLAMDALVGIADMRYLAPIGRKMDCRRRAGL